MLSSLRYLALMCLFLILVGTMALGFYFRELRGEEIAHDTQRQAQEMVAAYNDTIWRQLTSPTGPAISGTGSLETNSHTYFRNFPAAVKISIFSPDLKQSYFSSTPGIINDGAGARVTLFDLPSATQGRPVTRLIEKGYFTGDASNSQARTFTQAIVPIFAADISSEVRASCYAGSMAGGCTPVALAELYLDATPAWSEVKHQQFLFMGLLAIAFALLAGMLFFTTKRAESIIARQHEVNLELTAAAARAEAQSRDKSQFLASVSHELRTPLNAIIGFSEIVKNETKEHLQKIYLDYLEDIHASGRHLLSLINDILDFSKAEAGKLQIEWAETDVTKIIRNSLRMVLPRAESAQITLIEDIPTQHLVIITDAKKLKQVLLNLLSNAVKFTPAGGEVRCHAWEDVASQRLVIEVRDTGIGIAPKDLSRVMTPFGQVDSALSRKYEGTGLGLPLAKAFLESMGGEFAIESELNKGTTVSMALPKAPKEAYNAPTASPGKDPHVAPETSGSADAA